MAKEKIVLTLATPATKKRNPKLDSPAQKAHREMLREKAANDPKFTANHKAGNSIAQNKPEDYVAGVKVNTKAAQLTNPAGHNQFTKPKGAKLLSEGFQARIGEAAPERFALALGLEPGATYADVIVEQHLQLAALGSQESTNRARTESEGALPSKHEITGKDGAPLPSVPVMFEVVGMKPAEVLKAVTEKK